MRPITENIQSHLFPDDGLTYPVEWYSKKKPGHILRRVGTQPTTVAKVRRNSGCPVGKFEDLVRLVAQLANKNPRFHLLYRGQPEDHRNKKLKSSLYPTIYRPLTGRGNLASALRAKRFQELNSLVVVLKQHRKQLAIDERLAHHSEACLALLQHYERALTPLIDLTRSIRVAATFALRDQDSGRQRTEGFVYVIGTPHPEGSISHFVDDDFLMVNLQSVCPAYADRPHFQEGWLIGKLTYNSGTKEGTEDAGGRIVGKYRLLNQQGTFWSKDLPAIPERHLFPKEDPFPLALDRLGIPVVT